MSEPVTSGRPLAAPAPTEIVYEPAGWIANVITSPSGEAFAAEIAARRVQEKEALRPVGVGGQGDDQLFAPVSRRRIEVAAAPAAAG